MKIGQEHEKRSPKRLNGLQRLESEKSNVTTHGRSFSGNMEHIPIKKRRLFLRSPSPPLPSRNRQEMCEGFVGSQFSTDQNTCTIAVTESQHMGTNIANGSMSKNSNSDGNIDKCSLKSSNVARGLADDFSGIAILAAAACSDRFDNSADDGGKVQSHVDDLLDMEQNKLFVSASDKKESIPSIQSPDLLRKNIDQVEGVCVVNLPKDSAQVVRENNDADDACMSPIYEFQNMKQNESVASTSFEKGSVECRGSTDSLRTAVLHVNNESPIDLPSGVAAETSENSDVPRGFRLHWDLNTVMDEWGHPIEDAGFDPCTPSVYFQNLEDVESSEAKRTEIEVLKNVEGSEAKRSEGTESNSVGSEAEICTGAEKMMLPDNEFFTSVSPTISRIRRSEVSSGFLMCLLKENSSRSNGNDVVESSICATGSEIQPAVVNKDIRTLASEEPNDGAACENPNESSVETVRSPMQIVQYKEHEIGSLLAFSGSSVSEVKDADCKHIEDFKARNFLDGSDIKVENLTCQPTAPKYVCSSNCEIASADATELGETSCQVSNLNCKNPEQLDQISLANSDTKLEEVIVQPSEPHPSSFKDSMEAFKDSSISLRSIEVDNMDTTPVTTSDDQPINLVIAPLNDHESEALVPKLLDHYVVADAGSKLTNDHPVDKSLGGDYGSFVSNQDSSQVTDIGETELERGYDSHLEDGELRDSHCWENNEGEDGETEHVDYDLDNRDGIVFDEANDSVQLPGEVLAECGKQNRCLQNFSRSKNFDCMHHIDDPDEPLNRGQQPSLRMGRFEGSSWNSELKSIVANPASEEGGERILRGSGDNSPLRGRRLRIMSTSQSGISFGRRGSPGRRDGDYGMGMMKGRDFSPDNNSRGRFRRFNGMGRGFREGYRRPIDYEGPNGGGGPMLNHFARRDRSFSPGGDRLYRKSRSGSRTRSPDFRSEARMGRGRMPYQKANYAADHTRERRSPVRVFKQNQRFDTVGSPGRLRSDDCIRPTMRPMRFHDATTYGKGHDFEETDDYRRKPLLMRNDRRSRSKSRSCSPTCPDFRSDTRTGTMKPPYQPSPDHIRDGRSVFRPDQRYKGGGSAVRLRSDECLRPMMRPVRFPDTGQPARGHEYNDDNNSNNNNNGNGDGYRRKPRNIHEIIHRIRHHNVEGDGRRFQYEEEDGVPTQNFRRNENYARAGDRRSLEFRGPREKRGNIRYNNSERMFYSGPKQFGGMRD